MSSDLNPYQPPAADITDIPTRSELTTLIRSFLSSEISAFEFDEKLDPFHGSDDELMQFVVANVWFYYDDCDDHFVCFSKTEWDYFQRLLLILESDCQVETQRQRSWSFRQLVAAAALFGFCCLANQFGWGSQLLILSIPFGIVSIGLAYCPRRETPAADPFEPIIYPFATFSDLANAYRSGDFRKTRYPKSIGSRKIRSPFMDWFGWLHAHVIWLIFAPIPLLVQMLPNFNAEVRFICQPTE